MNKATVLFICLLGALAPPMPAQETALHHIGIKAGPFFATVRRGLPEGSVTETDRKLTVGVHAEIGLGPWFAVQPEIDLITTVYTWSPPLMTDIYTDTLQYLQVPVLFKARLVRDGWIVPAVFAGPCAGVLFRARGRNYNLDVRYYLGLTDVDRAADRSWKNSGLMITAGLGF